MASSSMRYLLVVPQDEKCNRVKLVSFRPSVGKAYWETATEMLDDRAAEGWGDDDSAARDDDTLETFPLSDEDERILSDKIRRLISSTRDAKSARSDGVERRDDGEGGDASEVAGMVFKVDQDAEPSFSIGTLSECLSVDSDGGEFVMDAIAKNLSMVSKSEFPVRESQPIGGPKYYIATDTAKGQARVVHEAMTSDVFFFQKVAEERGYEIMEYNLVKKKEKEPVKFVGCFSDMLWNKDDNCCASDAAVTDTTMDTSGSFTNDSFSYTTMNTATFMGDIRGGVTSLGVFFISAKKKFRC